MLITPTKQLMNLIDLIIKLLTKKYLALFLYSNFIIVYLLLIFNCINTKKNQQGYTHY